MHKSNIKLGGKVSLQSLSGGMAGDLKFNHRYLIGKNKIKEFGFEIFEGKHSLMGIDFISKNPNKRATDLMDSIKREDDLIIANIGGFDSHKLIPFLNKEEIKSYPTTIIGYSDITSLHLFFYTLGIQTYYGPTTLDGFAENKGMHEITKNSFLDIVVNDNIQEIKSAKEWTSEYLDWTNKEYDFTKRKMNREKHGHLWKNFNSNIDGKLIGGCLDTIVQIHNKTFFPSVELWKDTVIFLETSEQKMMPDAFRKSLILLSKEINSSKAVLFGKPKDEAFMKEYQEIFLDLFDVPVIFNINIGHTAPIYTIPYGGTASLLVDQKKILIKK